MAGQPLRATRAVLNYVNGKGETLKVMSCIAVGARHPAHNLRHSHPPTPRCALHRPMCCLPTRPCRPTSPGRTSGTTFCRRRWGSACSTQVGTHARTSQLLQQAACECQGAELEGWRRVAPPLKRRAAPVPADDKGETVPASDNDVDEQEEVSVGGPLLLLAVQGEWLGWRAARRALPSARAYPAHLPCSPAPSHLSAPPDSPPPPLRPPHSAISAC